MVYSPKNYKTKDSNLTVETKKIKSFKHLDKRKNKRFIYVKLDKYRLKKNKYNELLYFFIIEKIFLKSIKRLRKVLLFRFKKKIIKALNSKEKYLKKITIRVSQNNIFCSFINLKSSKTLHVGSSGIYKIKVTKKKLKYVYKEIINLFFDNIESNYKNLNRTLFSIVAPIRKIRANITKLVKSRLVKKRFNTLSSIKKIKHVLINIVPKKCFNGCRVNKKIKKKRKWNRILK
jgi:hypothetical protein